MSAATRLVETTKFTRSVPPATVTLAGRTTTWVLALVKVTTAPPDGARPFSTTVPVEELPPITSSGSRKNEVTWVAASVAVTVNGMDNIWVPRVAVMVTTVVAATATVCTPTTEQLLPCGNDGAPREATAGLLLAIVKGMLPTSGAGFN